MRHRSHRYRLGRVSEHRTALLRNLLVALFRHERIRTTEAKAKAVRPLADRMVTLAKREHLHARRQVFTMVPDAQVVGRLFDAVAARFADRNGGYTRIIRSDVRPGDAAPMVLLELVDRAETPSDKGKKDEKKSRKPGKDEGKTKGKAASPRKKKEKAAAASA